MIKDKLILSNESNYFYKPCFSCQKNSHEISKCPTLNPVLNKSLIIKKYNIPISQNREFVYRKRKKLNTRALKLLIQTTQKIFSLNSDQEDKKIFSINKIMTESMEFEEKENLPDNELESPYLNKSSITKVKSAPIKTRPTDKISVSNNKKPEENLQKINSEEKIKINSSEEINNLKNSINDSKNTKSEDNYLNENFSYINSIKPSKKKSSKEDFFNEIHDFERMKFFAKYQPNFNFDVIIMLANKEYYYRLKKNGSKKKKYRKKKRSNYEYNQRGMFKATFSLFKNRPNSKMKFLQTPELASIDNIEN